MANHIRLPLALTAAATTPPVEPSRPAVGEPSSPSLDGMMQVGDLARETGKTVRAIHLYEELDLLRPAARSKGRFRLYGHEALLRIRWISKLQELGFSLSDIQAVAKDFDANANADGSASVAMARIRDLYRTKVEETRAQLQRLHALEHELTQSLDYLETCEVCDPQRLVTACKNCDQHASGAEAPELVAGFRAKPS
jgi:MerR family transcriptional regulator, copper efflux regulator